VKRLLSLCLACLVMLALATELYADQKVKKRMSFGQQSFDSTSYIKGQRSRDEMNFGQMQMVTIHQCDAGQDITLNDRTKTYMVTKTGAKAATPAAGAKTGAKAPPQDVMEYEPPAPEGAKKGGTVTISTSIQDTGERKDLFGYEARHLKTSMHMQSSPDACDPNKSTTMSTDGWYINFKEKVQFCERPMAGGGDNSPMRRSEPSCVDKIKMTGAGVTSMFSQGYPVDVTTSVTDDKGKTTSFRQQALEISSATLDASLFDAPAGYRQAKSYADMMGMNMGSMMGALGRGALNSRAPSMTPEMRGGGMTPEARGGRRVGRRMAGTSEIGPKAPGKLRVGVVAFNDKTGKVTDADKLRKSLMDGIEHYGYEAVPIDSQSQDAAMKDCKDLDCDYIVFNDMTVKASNAQTAKKFGKLMGGLAMGPLGAAAMGAATNGPQFFEGSVDFQLYKMATPDPVSLTGTNDAKGQNGGKDAMDKESKDVAKQIAKGR
jgi:hypothetical protein